MFKQARLKLTAWYLLIIMVISASFSFLIYQLINTEINRFANSQRNRIERRLVVPNPNMPPQLDIFLDDQDLISESQERLKINLLIINGVILVISGSLSYFLAGLTLKPIQQMIEDQKRFISDASHELRTPITALKSLFEVSLRDKKLSLKDAKKVLSDGINQSDRLNNLSNSILELSRLDVNHIQKQFTSLPLKKIISESILQIKPKATAKKIKIISKISPVKIFGDQERLIELFVIFLDNAIKYSPQNTAIKVISQTKKNQIIIKVIDHGIGIEPKDLPYIFNRFYQSDTARTKKDSAGYGLGLSIAQKIITTHSGSIKVSSQLGKGTKFTIYLPLFS